MIANWHKSYSNIEPPKIDNTSSQYYVYIRKNIELIETESEMGKEQIYQYDELILPKEVYPVYEKEIENEGRISDLEEAIVEIFGGGA